MEELFSFNITCQGFEMSVLVSLTYPDTFSFLRNALLLQLSCINEF